MASIKNNMSEETWSQMSQQNSPSFISPPPDVTQMNADKFGELFKNVLLSKLVCETACQLLQRDAAMTGRSWSVHSMGADSRCTFVGHVQATCPDRRAAWALSPSPAPGSRFLSATFLPPRCHTLIPSVLLADGASSEATLAVFQGLAWPTHHHRVQAPETGRGCFLLPFHWEVRPGSTTRLWRWRAASPLRCLLKAEENLKLFQPKVSLYVNKSCQPHLMEKKVTGKRTFSASCRLQKKAGIRQDKLSVIRCFWKNMHTVTEINDFNSGLSRSLKSSKG